LIVRKLNNDLYLSLRAKHEEVNIFFLFPVIRHRVTF
jgi:hypothetical protein